MISRMFSFMHVIFGVLHLIEREEAYMKRTSLILKTGKTSKYEN